MRNLTQVYDWDNLKKPRQWTCHLNEATNSGCDLVVICVYWWLYVGTNLTGELTSFLYIQVIIE